MKKVFYSLIPFIVLIFTDGLDGFIGWKKINTIVRNQTTVATITDNTYYNIATNNHFAITNGAVDDDSRFFDYVIKNRLYNKGAIYYSYSDGAKLQHDSLSYLYTEYEGTSALKNEMMYFVEGSLFESPSHKFQVLHYGGYSLPRDVVTEAIRIDGKFKFYIGLLFPLLIAFLCSGFIFWSMYLNQKRKI